MAWKSVKAKIESEVLHVKKCSHCGRPSLECEYCDKPILSGDIVHGSTLVGPVHYHVNCWKKDGQADIPFNPDARFEDD